MSIFIDRSFLLRISPRLQKFAQKKEDLYNFRCPICGDSQKNKSKARGYVFRKDNNYCYMCHNCGASMSFYNFLEKVDSNMIKEYALERYKHGDQTKSGYKAPKFEEFKTEAPKFKKKIDLPSIEELPQEHYARVYVKDRQIPREFWKELYYTPDFKQFIAKMGIEKDNLIDNDPRLVIPFYDFENDLTALQGRSLNDSKVRYITVKVTEQSNKIYGLDRLDLTKDIYVVEGPIDSMFLPNCVATADSNLMGVTNVFDKSKVVLVYDNEPRNKEICKQMETAIDDHYRVVIWPESIDCKDVNDMVLDEYSPEEIHFIVDKNTHVNLRAKMEFINWKKV